MTSKKIFINLISIFSLCSCTESFDWRQYFANHPWTKWTSDNGKYVFYIEGSGSNCMYPCRYFLMDGSFIEGFIDLTGSRNTESSSFCFDGVDNLYYEKEYVDDNSFKINASNNNPSGYSELTFISSKIEENEIISKYLGCRYLVSTTDEWVLYSPSMDSYGSEYIPLYYCGFYRGHYIQLTFNDDNSFSFKSNGSQSTGMSFPTYESITLKFDENHIFDKKDDITFTYEYNNYDMDQQITYGLDIESIFPN